MDLILRNRINFMSYIQKQLLQLIQKQILHKICLEKEIKANMLW